MHLHAPSHPTPQEPTERAGSDPDTVVGPWWRKPWPIATVVVVLSALVASLFMGFGQTPSAVSGSYSIFPAATAPSNTATNDPSTVELGVTFKTTSDGWITAIRYYKSAQNTGPHTASLWSADGTRLSTVTFANESTSGWQEAQLGSRVQVNAGSTYTASYRAPAGRYSYTYNNLSAKNPRTNQSLTATAGVFTYSSGMPRSTWQDTNYFVDVAFTPAATAPPARPVPTTPAPTPTTTAPSDGGTVVLGRSFPSAATTGVPPGTSLSPYTGPCSIQTNNVVINAKTINCDLRILAQNVTIKNSIINGTIYSDPDYFNGSFTLTDSEVRMPASAGTGIGDVNFTVTRVEVTGGSRSINCAANCTVADSYLHGQYTDKRGIDHESAVRMGARSTIRHNTITCDSTPVPPDAGCSAALTGYGDFAIVEKNTIDNNLIDGGPYGSMGYCAYGGSTTGKPFSNGVNTIKFTNNIFMRGPNNKCGIWGPITSFDTTAPGNQWSNNLWNDGKTVPPAN